MSAIVSTAAMIKRLEGLLDTKDLSAWEQGFVKGLARRTGPLTDDQVEKLVEIHDEHFA